MSPAPAPRYRLRRRGAAGPVRRFFASLSAALTALIALWLTGLFWFSLLVPDAPEDSTTPTHAIVVLTGGAERLEEGFRLLSDGRGRKLLVSGVYHGVDVAQLFLLARQSPAELACCVSLGYQAEDTEGNAYETALWMKENGFDSLRLVTASYHMPRSLLEFARALPGIRLVPHPVFPAQFRREAWWRFPGTARLLVSEYSKYLLALIRPLFFPPPGFTRAPGQLGEPFPLPPSLERNGTP